MEEFKRPDITLNFIVESGDPNEGAPVEILSQIKRKKIAEVSEYLGSAIPGEKRKYPGLQAADGLATGAWHMEKTGAHLVPDSPLGIAGLIKQQKMPVFRCHIDKKELNEFTEGYFEHIKYRQEYWTNRRSK